MGWRALLRCWICRTSRCSCWAGAANERVEDFGNAKVERGFSTCTAFQRCICVFRAHRLRCAAYVGAGGCWICRTSRCSCWAGAAYGRVEDYSNAKVERGFSTCTAFQRFICVFRAHRFRCAAYVGAAYGRVEDFGNAKSEREFLLLRLPSNVKFMKVCCHG